MARPATGRVEVEQQADGTLRFRLRFRANGKRESQMLHEARDCACGCGGGWTENNARVELNNILARVKAGIWERPKAPPAVEKRFKEIPTFHEFASYWLQAKLEGIIGKKPISTNTHAGYKISLQNHLLPFFGRYRLDEIDKDLCAAFKKHLIKEAHELTEALAAGADLRDENNRTLRPLGPASIRGLLNLLGQILEEAVEDELISFNHARSKRLKVHVPKPKRTFLEMDELACVEDAAAEQDPSLERFALAAREARDGSTAQAVAIRLSEGKRQKQIVAELGVAPGTVHFHVRKLGAVRRRRLRRPQGDRLHTRALRRPQRRAERHTDRPPAPARPQQRPPGYPRLQDRDRHQGRGDQPLPSRSADRPHRPAAQSRQRTPDPRHSSSRTNAGTG